MIVRDGSFDVVIAPAPRVAHWPSIGVTTLSKECSRVGLKVGILGENGIQVRGLIPQMGTGGVVIAQDQQHRIHRLQTRALVRVSLPQEISDPFPGSRSQGLLPVSTAMRVLKSKSIRLDQTLVILGTGNRALRLGSQYLEMGAKEVVCIESNESLWGKKKIAGWEVEQRRFMSTGGKIIFGTPLSLTEKGGLLWDLRVQDTIGVRILTVSRVISAGPFSHELPFREYPAGSMLFEFTQHSGEVRENDIEGWDLELNSSRFVATRMIKSLITDLGHDRDRIDSIFKKSKQKLRSRDSHLDDPFVVEYEGKWIKKETKTQIQKYAGVPKRLHQQGLMASVECFEDISCQICHERCPESAIQIVKHGVRLERVLIEDKCTACGICVKACPSRAITLINEPTDKTEARLVVPVATHHAKRLKTGEFVTLVNRQGDRLSQGRMMTELKTEVDTEFPGVHLIEIQTPSHLVNETRQFKLVPSLGDELEVTHTPLDQTIEVSLDGNKRRVRAGISVTQALFELGVARELDVLSCPDGSCRLCQINVDGIKRLACQTEVHSHMHIQLKKGIQAIESTKEDEVCACLGITRGEVESRIEKGKLSSPEQIRASTHVGEGRCLGQSCIPLFNRILQEKGVDGSRWVDWRFPWSEWVVSRGISE
ncbi:MAG: (2Fe-2S)-binding protein [Xanthomonadaceae bacterium]|nr:(2Fe-2S)-binding protein [Xanthomonadaceae bacterium]